MVSHIVAGSPTQYDNVRLYLQQRWVSWCFRFYQIKITANNMCVIWCREQSFVTLYRLIFFQYYWSIYLLPGRLACYKLWRFTMKFACFQSFALFNVISQSNWVFPYFPQALDRHQKGKAWGLYLLSSLRAMFLLESDDFHASSRVSPDLSLRKIRAYSSSSLSLIYVLKKLFDKFFPFSFSFFSYLKRFWKKKCTVLIRYCWYLSDSASRIWWVVNLSSFSENKLSRSHVIWSHPPYHISLFRATIKFNVNLGFVAWCIYLPYWVLPTSFHIKAGHWGWSFVSLNFMTRKVL